RRFLLRLFFLRLFLLLHLCHAVLHHRVLVDLVALLGFLGRLVRLRHALFLHVVHLAVVLRHVLLRVRLRRFRLGRRGGLRVLLRILSERARGSHCQRAGEHDRKQLLHQPSPFLSTWNEQRDLQRRDFTRVLP